MLYQLSYFRKALTAHKKSGQRWIRTTVGVRQQIYSLPHLATLVSAQNFSHRFKTRRSVGADGGIRTHDLLITNQLL